MYQKLEYKIYTNSRNLSLVRLTTLSLSIHLYVYLVNNDLQIHSESND